MTAQVAFVRILFAPVLIISATYVGRRNGTLGGLIAGLPLTSGPVSVLLLAAHGRYFAAEAAVGTIRGLAATIVFIAGFMVTARGNWARGLASGTLLSIAATVAMGIAAPGLWLASVIIALLTVLSFAALPSSPGDPPEGLPPWWDLPVRALVAAMVVWMLVTSASLLGPDITGLLSPAPVFAAIMLTFAAIHGHTGTTIARGMLHGSFGFVAFFICCAILLGPLGWPAYLVASVAAVMVPKLTLLIASGMSAVPA